MKTIIGLMALICISNVSFAQDSQIKIQCGDLRRGYISMDLTDQFKLDYLSSVQEKQYKEEGYNYKVAGRNCGLNTWDSREREYEVLFLFKGKKLSELPDFGPMTIKQGEIYITGASLEDLEDGIVLSGESFDSLAGENNVTAVLKSERGYGKAKVIIRQH